MLDFRIYMFLGKMFPSQIEKTQKAHMIGKFPRRGHFLGSADFSKACKIIFLRILGKKIQFSEDFSIGGGGTYFLATSVGGVHLFVLARFANQNLRAPVDKK